MFNFKIYKAYLESSKPRVVLLMIFTSFIGMLLADPLHLNFKILILGNLGIALMSLSAGNKYNYSRSSRTKRISK